MPSTGFKAGANPTWHSLLDTGTMEEAPQYIQFSKKPEDIVLEQREQEICKMQKWFWENRWITWKKQGWKIHLEKSN